MGTCYVTGFASCLYRSEIKNLKDISMVVWENLKSLFDKLNQECTYLVLRNYENMDREDLFCANHEDIDVLCDDYEQFIRVAGAKRLYGPEDNIHLSVNVNGTIVPIDLRCVGDNYYDKQWEKDMLATRQIVDTKSGSWYVMSAEHYYYSLVYHAYIQKKKLSDDYPVKLQILAEAIEKGSSTKEQHIRNLIEFLETNHYTCPYPEDISVPLNAELLPVELIRDEMAAWEAGREILYPINKKIKAFNKLQRLCDLLRGFFSGERKTAFLCAFLVGLVIHWKMFSEKTVMTSVGLPGLYVVLLLSTMGVSALLLTDLFKIKDKSVAGVIGVFVATCPLLAVVFSNTEGIFLYCIAQTLAILSVRIFLSNRRGHIVVSMGLLFATAFLCDYMLLTAVWILCIKMLTEMIAEKKTGAKNRFISIVIFLIMALICFCAGMLLHRFNILPQVQEIQMELTLQAMIGNAGGYAVYTFVVPVLAGVLILKDRLKRGHYMRGVAWMLSVSAILGFVILTGKVYG